MRLTVLLPLFLVQCLIATSLAEIERSIRPEVTTANGVIRGTSVVASNGKEVFAFYGIPFAKPPVGELRFRRPLPYTEKWNVPFEANQLPNACAQISIQMFANFTGEEIWVPNTKISDDCLYLNVWVPVSQFKRKTNVLFWIYGGGFYSGSSSLDIYNGATLASEQDSIVVSSQYRLGAQGFLYFGTEEAPGNMGLLDQNLALSWTNDNIRAFGGDPAEITLFGESGGAASVSYQLLSPLSQNLFKRAVLMSGVATAPWAYRTPSELIQVSYEIAKHAGCSSDAEIKDPAKTVECLNGVDTDTLIRAIWKIPKQILELPITPTTDGYFILDEPYELVKKWDTKRSEILIGNTADEGSYFLVYKYMKYFSYLKSSSISYDGFLSIMRDIFKDWPTVERDAILFHYTNWENREDGFVNSKAISDAVGDAFFNCPLRDFADQWSARGLAVYYYFFTENTDSDPWGKWMGSKHGDEIVYFFGQPVNSSYQYTPREQELSKKTMDLLSTFAKTGRPAKGWERYTRDYPLYVDLNATVISDETRDDVHGPRAEACAFWNIYLPQLRKNLELASTNENILAQRRAYSDLPENCNTVALEANRITRAAENEGGQISHKHDSCCC